MRILYVTRSPPWPATIGGNQRTHLMYRALSQVGDVDLLLAVSPEELAPSQRQYIEEHYHLAGYATPQRRCERPGWRWAARCMPAIGDRLAEVLSPPRLNYAPDPVLQGVVRSLHQQRQYDVAVVKSLRLARQTGLSPHFPVIVDADDVEYEWYESQVRDPHASLARKALAAWRLANLAGTLDSWYREYPFLWVTKQSDRQWPGMSAARVVGVPFYTSDASMVSAPPDVSTNRNVLMVGSYHHGPNREGLEWFLRNVWPLLLILRPDARFEVVGGGLDERFKARFALPHVEFTGVVEDLSDVYSRCAVTIAPIFRGAGINVKVFESYFYGRPCVATRFAYRGYERCLEIGEMIRIEDDPAAYARACVELLGACEVRRSMSDKGRARVLRDFSFGRFAGVVAETIREAMRHKNSRSGQPQR